MSSFKAKIHTCLSQTIAIKRAKGEHYKAKLMERGLTNILDSPITNLTTLESVKGVGPMTLAALMYQTVVACEKNAPWSNEFQKTITQVLQAPTDEN